MSARATLGLFDDTSGDRHGRQEIGPDAFILRGFVSGEDALLDGIEAVHAHAPFRHMVTPGGRAMSVAMTNCGPAGWVSDTHGYRYCRVDPLSGAPWPHMPAAFVALARTAATVAGFPSFEPDACLINRYEPGARLSLHQDKDERDFEAPIVSVSLGLPAIFLFGGARRTQRPARHRLEHGDVVVWGGAARCYFHGVAAIEDGVHARLGRQRINLTFRKTF